MSDRIEVMLTNALNDAAKQLSEARRNVRVIELDANRIERLLAIHLQMTEDEAPPTEAFPAVPPAADWSQEDTWKPWIGTRITVSYADGSTVTGVLEDTSYRRYRLTDVPELPADEVYVGALVSVTGVVPAEAATQAGPVPLTAADPPYTVERPRPQGLDSVHVPGCGVLLHSGPIAGACTCGADGDERGPESTLTDPPATPPKDGA